jgi:hypothetical protein
VILDVSMHHGLKENEREGAAVFISMISKESLPNVWCFKKNKLINIKEVREGDVVFLAFYLGSYSIGQSKFGYNIILQALYVESRDVDTVQVSSNPLANPGMTVIPTKGSILI